MTRLGSPYVRLSSRSFHDDVPANRMEGSMVPDVSIVLCCVCRVEVLPDADLGRSEQVGP